MAGKEHATEPFFIVDNSDEHWKALEYLRQWCQISEAIDIATGYFEVGALLALDGEWQKVDKIRILVGDETGRQTVEVIRKAMENIDVVLEKDKDEDPFLEGLPAVVDAIRSGKIEIKVYKKKKFHAKSYITHGRLEVVGSAALVGSSNFTKPGLTRNVELNVRFTGVEVRELQEWFRRYWDEAEDLSPDVLKVLEKHSRDYTPFEVYAKAMQVLTDDVEPGATEWERNESVMYPILAPYQREAYHGLKQRAARWDGAFLTDGVGLGKTFVGLMLTEYFAVKERKNVLVLATKTGRDAVWNPDFDRYLPDLTGEFTNVAVMAHTDLSSNDGLERARRLAKRVNVVIIDEAHNFRNHGKKAEKDEEKRSRWWRLQELCKGKQVFLLTATPINNSVFDFVHEFELFTGLEDAHFATAGVTSVRNYFTQLDKDFAKHLDTHAVIPEPSMVTLSEFQRRIFEDKLLGELIVQNSRQYAKKSSIAAGGTVVKFPEPEMPRSVPYTYDLGSRRLLSEIEQAFLRRAPLFTLPMYYPLAYSKREDIDTSVKNRQQQVVGLIRTIFLKRFESSIAAFAGSCADLAAKITRWIESNAQDDPERLGALEELRSAIMPAVERVHSRFRPGAAIADEFVGEIGLSDDDDDDVLEEVAGQLDPDEYKVDEMLDAALEDLRQLGTFLELAVQVDVHGDQKLEQLLSLLTGKRVPKYDPNRVFDPRFRDQKVIVFTEFADTARYLYERLKAAGVQDIDHIDGSRKASRLEMIQRFAPHYNRVETADRKKLKPLRVLISTDVLSEGVNLQDASLIVNYDIHWNPVRLIQRIGRVDRRLDEEREQAIIAENPKVKDLRGKVVVRNFLPPSELNRLLSLYQRVQSRAILISETLGIPGGHLLSEADMLNDTKVFAAFLEDYEGEISPIEQLRLDYLELLGKNPGLEDDLNRMPRGIHAAKAGEPAGLFTCSVEPKRMTAESGQRTWTLEGGEPRWAMQLGDGEVTTDIQRIHEAIRCETDDEGQPILKRGEVAQDLAELRKQRTQELMKNAGLPLDAPPPQSICWMVVQ